MKSLYDRRLLCAAYFALAGQSVSFDDLWLITSAPTIDRPGRKANRLRNLQFNKPASCSSGVELMVVVHIWKELSSKEKSLTRRTHLQLNLFHLVWSVPSSGPTYCEIESGSRIFFSREKPCEERPFIIQTIHPPLININFTFWLHKRDADSDHLNFTLWSIGGLRSLRVCRDEPLRVCLGQRI